MTGAPAGTLATAEPLVERVAARLAHGISRDSLARGFAGELVRSAAILAGDDADLAATIATDRAARAVAELRDLERRRVERTVAALGRRGRA